MLNMTFSFGFMLAKTLRPVAINVYRLLSLTFWLFLAWLGLWLGSQFNETAGLIMGLIGIGQILGGFEEAAYHRASHQWREIWGSQDRMPWTNWLYGMNHGGHHKAQEWFDSLTPEQQALPEAIAFRKQHYFLAPWVWFGMLFRHLCLFGIANTILNELEYGSWWSLNGPLAVWAGVLLWWIGSNIAHGHAHDIAWQQAHPWIHWLTQSVLHRWHHKDVDDHFGAFASWDLIELIPGRCLWLYFNLLGALEWLPLGAFYTVLEDRATDYLKAAKNPPQLTQVEST